MSWLRSPLQTPAPAPPYNRSAPFLTKKHLLPPTVRFMSWLWEFCLQYVSLYWGGKAEAAQVHQSHICLLQQIFSFPLQRAQIPVFYRRYFTLYLKKKICLQIVNSPVCDKLLLPPPWGQLATAAFPVWVQLHKEGSPRKVLFLFSKRGLTEYQVNLIAGKEKELLNRPAGRTMLCSSTHHLKYLSFWNT